MPRPWSAANVDIVPKVMVGGGGDGKEGMLGGNLLGALMAMMLSSRAGVEPTGGIASK